MLGVLIKCGARTFLKILPDETYPPIFPLVRCIEREFLRRAVDHRAYIENDVPKRVQTLYLELMNKYGRDDAMPRGGVNVERVCILIPRPPILS